MRDSTSCCLPVVRNPLDGLNHHLDVPNAGVLTNIAGNGYYGYFHPVQAKGNEQKRCDDADGDVMDAQGGQRREHLDGCPMEIERDPKRGHANRKRTWEDGGEHPFKKRRENELPAPTLPRNFSRPTSLLKQPTHNVPDMQRCIMGHYL